jgi:hypothetical protein
MRLGTREMRVVSDKPHIEGRQGKTPTKAQ